MTLSNVSDTYQAETIREGTAFPPIYAYEPPVNLADVEVYSKNDGYTFDAYAKMRENAPIMWHPEEYGAGFWAVTSYDLVKKVELNPIDFSSQKGGILMNYGTETGHPLLHNSSLNSMINLDRPHHARIRMEHMAYFKSNFVAELRKKVDDFIAERLDEMEKSGPVIDMVEQFSAELPLFTLCEMLGVDKADRPKLVHWMHFLEMASYQAVQEGLGSVTQEQIMLFMNEIQAMFDFGRSVLNERRKNPREDLLSAIAHTKIDGEQLNEQFLDGSWLLIVFAGNDTTRNSLSGTMKLLTQFPEIREQLKANPDLFPNFVQESIRMVSPVTYMRRTTTKDTELGGQAIGEGEKVVMFYSAANRDPNVFEDPDTFKIDRENSGDHLAFGHGPHVCIGQRVANMQLESAYRQILDRFPNVRWTGKGTIAPNNFVHAISSLEIDLGT